MKKLLILTMISLIGFVSCDKKKVNIDPYTQIALNASQTKVLPTAPYPIDTIIEYAWETHFWCDDESPERPKAMGIPTRDTVNKKFWFGNAQCVIYNDKQGVPTLGWMVNSNLRDLVVVAIHRKDLLNQWVHYQYQWLNDDIDWAHYDTIGYVPNRVIKAAEAEIHAAFDAQDYDKCLQLFETAYVFQPITGAQWRELKANNQH